MPGSFLNDTERERLRGFPAEIPSEDLIGYFTLSERDRLLVRGQRRAHNRLGFALQVCALRYLGFVPAKLHSAPPAAVGHLAEQLGVAPAMPRQVRGAVPDPDESPPGSPGPSRLSQGPAQRPEGPQDLARRPGPGARPAEPALPTRLRETPHRQGRAAGVDLPRTVVVAAQQQAQHETFRLLTPLLSDDTKTLLDGLLVPDVSRGGTALTWLRRAAVSNSPKAILRNIEKLEFLKGAGVARWALGGLSPNRLKRLAQIARRATGQALQRMPEERRYPLLVAFLHQSLVDVTDETIDQFDRCLAEAYARAGRDLEEFRSSMAQATNETVRLFGELARVVLDPTVRDAQLRHAIYRRIPPERLRKAVEESGGIVRPDDDSGLDFLRKRYGHLRQFVPAFLAAFPFRSNVDPDPLLKAVDLLRRLGDRRGPSLPRKHRRRFRPGEVASLRDRRPGTNRPGLLRALRALGAARGLAGRGCLAGIQPSLLRTRRRT